MTFAENLTIYFIKYAENLTFFYSYSTPLPTILLILAYTHLTLWKFLWNIHSLHQLAVLPMFTFTFLAANDNHFFELTNHWKGKT